MVGPQGTRNPENLQTYHPTPNPLRVRLKGSLGMVPHPSLWDEVKQKCETYRGLRLSL